MRQILAVMLCICLLPFPVCAESPKYIALTFDDGPSGRFTRRLLDGLDERDVKVTFFLCGYRIEQYPEETARIFESGHEIGIHGFSHKNMKTMSRREIADEIARTRALLPEGCHPVWLRPPGGCCSDAVRQVCEVSDLSVLIWSLDPKDWNTNAVSAIKNTVIRTAKDGDVVLLHDMSDSSVDAALEIIDALGARGYRFVTVSELADARNIAPCAGECYRAFPIFP